ncbi:putative UDP-glucuronate:xylan alpha-glucuronosyltransferase 4 [Silene latifolia]|uniref:putative UDP-glucuronate:xylan alpha-glucuronosyltransferase 4 n=1 Tax=Silene latifolia TaxID=37657 RepID=UPI003D7783CF
MPNFPKTYSMVISLSLRPRFMLFSLFSLLISVKIILVTHHFRLTQPTNIIHLDKQSLSTTLEPPKWLDVIKGNYLAHKERDLRVGFFNFEANQLSPLLLRGIVDPVTIELEPISPNVTWDKLFPAVIGDNPRCPEIPTPNAREYPTLDVVVAQLPCGEGYNKSQTEGIRDVHRLQLSLATAHLIVESAMNGNESKDVYGVFISKCEPMVEMFRCDDLIWNEGDYWIYKPEVDRLKEILNMPIGTCEFALPYVGDPNEPRTLQLQVNSISKHRPKAMMRQKEAYVTVLHSSESYVCGAITLAHSILLTNTTKDLVQLADRTISNHSIAGLQAAGWKIKWIERIKSPYAKVTAYNVWNYSKLRVWQLIEYSKVIFIDSDFIVLRNLDHFFHYPQLTARLDHGFYFNSGIILLEPSECLFNTLMNKRFTLNSYNGGDQGYMNEVLTYWHRVPLNLSSMKVFLNNAKVGKRAVSMNPYTIHFFGLKPWTCYRDYDCNWDSEDLRKFASDHFHSQWWKVHDDKPKQLQMHCSMTKTRDATIRQWLYYKKARLNIYFTKSSH